MENNFSIDMLLQQELESRLSIFDFDKAWQLGTLLRERAAFLKAPVSIEIYAFGQIIFLAALPGSSADNIEWMKRKRNTVLRYAHSSMYVGIINASKGEAMVSQPFIDSFSFTDHGGSFPILNQCGSVIGAVSVSGLPSEDDHTLAFWGIQKLKRSL